MEHQREQAAGSARTRALVIMALFAALACTATMVIKIPSPTGGYTNLGDTVVLLGAYLLGPVNGAVAAGVGSALADLLSGAAAYVPGTLIIKAVMAVLAALLYQAVGRTPAGVLACGIVGEAPMVVGYWLYDALLLSGNGDFVAALAASAAGIPGNFAQAGFGLAASTLLLLTLRKNAYARQQFPRLGQPT